MRLTINHWFNFRLLILRDDRALCTTLVEISVHKNVLVHLLCVWSSLGYSLSSLNSSICLLMSVFTCIGLVKSRSICIAKILLVLRLLLLSLGCQFRLLVQVIRVSVIYPLLSGFVLLCCEVCDWNISYHVLLMFNFFEQVKRTLWVTMIRLFVMLRRV